MRIAIDTQSTVGQRTGIGQYTAHLLDALAEVGPQHTYVPLTWGKDLPMRLDRRLWWQQVQVPRQAQRARPDVLHIPGFDAPRWRVAPTVLTCHDLIGMLYPKNLPPVARFYWSRWLPYSLRFADAIIADSHATRRDIERLTAIPPTRIQVIHLGVEPRFQPASTAARAACRARYHLPARYILYVGTLEPRKGIDTLVDAFTQLAPQHPDLDLVIAGKKGWYWQAILDKITAANLTARVHLTGYVADDDLPALYSEAAMLAFPSRYEGFGLPLLEAMACGTPVVCTNVSSLPEICGDTGLLVPPDAPDALAAALTRLLTDTDFALSLCARGRARAAQFTWQRTARQTLNVYASLL